MQSLDKKSAAKFAKVSRSTIYTKIEKGELSAREDGRIDVSELIRVFGEPSDKVSGKERREQTQRIEDTARAKTPRERELAERLKQTEEQLQMAREIARKAEEREEQAREAEAWLRKEYEKLSDSIKLLEDKRQEPKPKAWYKRIFGG